MKQNVFIIGSKGIPAQYGGYESFVEQLTARKVSDNIHYFVACRKDLSTNKNDTFMVDCKFNPNAVRAKKISFL
ncbi:DUF1972 domain-containing protein [Pediococcus pentosaceus]